MKIKSHLLLGLVITSLGSPAMAYPDTEMDACVISAMNAAYTKKSKATIQDIENYCHCALTRILDQLKPVRESLIICNRKYFR